MKKFYVYAILSSGSEEVLYVGKGSGNRIQVSLDRISSRYPGVSLEARKLFSGLEAEEALKKETQLISEIQPKENKIASWVREKEHTRFGKASVYFSVGAEVREFLEGARKRVRVVVGGFEIVLNPLVFGESFNLVCRKMEDGASRAKFYVSLVDNTVSCSGAATGVVEPSVLGYVEEATLYSVVQSLAQSCFNLLCGLAELPSRELSVDEVYWRRVDLNDATNKLPDGNKEEILKFFASTCAKQEYSRKDKSLIGVAQMLGFGFTLYTAGELAARKGLRADSDSRVCGIVFKKYVGAAKHRAFTLSLYDKTVEVADKTEALRDKEKKPAVLKNNQAMLEELKDEIKDRLRVEGQVYPDTFLRGLAGRFRGIMMQNAKKPEWMDEEGWARILGGNKMKGKDGKVVPDSYYRKSEFLRDSCATEATLRKVIQEMTRQLGLPVIFEAPSQKKLLERVAAEVKKFVEREGRQKEVEALMEEWSCGVDLSERSMNTASLPYKLRSLFLDKLGVDLFSCTAELPRMIRGALMTSTLSLAEQQEFLHGSPERVLELRSRMIKDAKALRSGMQLVPSSPAIAQVSW